MDSAPDFHATEVDEFEFDDDDETMAQVPGALLEPQLPDHMSRSVTTPLRRSGTLTSSSKPSVNLDQVTMLKRMRSITARPGAGAPPTARLAAVEDDDQDDDGKVAMYSKSLCTDAPEVLDITLCSRLSNSSV